MIFSSIDFILFFAVVLLGLLLLGKNTPQKGLLLAASYFFYAHWDWRFLSLIFISTGADYLVGLGLERATRSAWRRALLCLSLAVNLGLLAYFKYCNFFIESLSPLLESVGLNPGTLHIILPVGISFYTFQTLSYTIDIYRGTLRPTRNLLDFALFVGFFPQLVAGPIVRASHFLPQLREAKRFTRENVFAGFQRFCHGLFKKVFLADRLAIFSDHVFANAGAYDCPTTWLAALAYSMQIYFDFSGYSDMAIGTARIMGYDLGENFSFPYLSKSVQEFWHRWHMSLSSWVRDYIYIPLGGNRKGAVRTYVNLMLSMLLCGLWHGAAWTFVAWGGLHGVGLAANRLWSWRGEGQGAGLVGQWLAWTATLLFVVIGWVFFRAETFGHAERMLRQMFMPQSGVSWQYPFVYLALAGTVFVHWVKAVGLWKRLLLPDEPRWYTPTLLFSLVWMSVVFYTKGFNPFIYFQF